MKQHSSRRLARWMKDLRLRQWAVVAVCCALVGVVSISLIRAAAYTLSAEAETGIAGGKAVTASSSAASGGAYVRFGGAATQFGTLLTTTHAIEEVAQGVKLATLEISWKEYEPEEGKFDAAYAAHVKSGLDEFRQAGMQVTLALGLERTPDWVFDYPNSLPTDQAGRNQSIENDDVDADFVFNDKLRKKAQAYYDRINQDLGINNISYIRLTSGMSVEMLYPDSNYWAFGVNAQNGPDMPPTMARNPFPGWKPGDRSITTAQVRQWADWYVGALADNAAWQMGVFKAQGYTGQFHILTPGSGERPSNYSQKINQYLPVSGYVGNGAVWSKFYELLPDKRNAVVYISSVADLSGGNDSCTPEDRSVALDSVAADHWSATRWQSRIAAEFGMPTGGENPGFALKGENPELVAFYKDTSENGMMAAAFRQLKSCGLQTYYWAHDFNLWDGTVPFSEYARRIAELNKP